MTWEGSASGDALNLLAADALDALDVGDRSVVAALRQSPALDATARRYRDVAIALGATAARRAPRDLAGRILDAAAANRAPGTPTGPWAVARDDDAGPGRRSAPSPAGASESRAPGERSRARSIEVLRRTVQIFRRTVDEYPAQRWHSPVAAYTHLSWSARDLLAHLLGVEELFLAAFGRGDGAAAPDTEHDHIASTLAVVREAADWPIDRLVARWSDAVRRVLGLLDDLRDGVVAANGPVSFQGLVVPVQALATLRSFEIWTHTEDLQRAAGLPPCGLDGPQLQYLCRSAVLALPLELEILGRAASRTARVVLLGAGGGAWSISTDPRPSHDPVTLLVAEGIDFCRLAAKRLSPSALACRIEGDHEFAHEILDAASLFAM